MASEKQITILITGDLAVRAIAEINIYNFVRDYCTENNRPIPDYTQIGPQGHSRLRHPHVLTDFLFGDYSVNVMEYESPEDEGFGDAMGQTYTIHVNAIESLQKPGSIRFDHIVTFNNKNLSEEKRQCGEAFLGAARGTKPTISVQPAHQKSWKSLVFGFLCLVLTIGVFTALAGAGLLFTPFLAIPIVFLALTVITAIKIAYDDRSTHSLPVGAAQTPTPTNVRETTEIPGFDNLSGGALNHTQTQPPILSQPKSSKIKPLEKAKNLNLGELLVRQAPSDQNYQPLKNFVSNKLTKWDDVFQTNVEFVSLKERPFTDSELLPKMVPELGFCFLTNERESGFFNLPICTENAPFIREIINENYRKAFMKDGKDTSLKAEILGVLNGPVTICRIS